jgi:hypothetical protein
MRRRSIWFRILGDPVMMCLDEGLMPMLRFDNSFGAFTNWLLAAVN